MKVAVIGAGAMGSGIAQTFAQCDAVEKVYLCDIKQEFADGGLNKIKKGLDRLVGKGKMEQAAADAITGKIVTGLSDIAVDPDLVVEAALEVMDIKQDCFRKLQDEIVQNPDCIYASNTSSLSITQIGAGLSKPIIGMHFFNPAPVMKLVEVIAGINTPAETVEKVIEISKQLGKVPVQVNEAAGDARSESTLTAGQQKAALTDGYVLLSSGTVLSVGTALEVAHTLLAGLLEA